MATDVNKSILDALEAGYGPQDIIDHIKSSENPAHQEWYNNYSTNMQTRANEQSAPVSAQQKTNTGILNAIDSADPTALGLGAAGVYLATQGPKLYNAYQERKLDREKLSIENRRITAYEQQVGKQGLTSEAGVPSSIVQEPPKLSALEEARINTERAKAEAIQSKIALEERKVAAMELRAKADAETKAAKAALAAKQKTTASGAISPADKQMLESSEVAKLQKASDAALKAQNAAVAPVQNNAPVVPPSSLKGPEIQLTPQTTLGNEPIVSNAVSPNKAPAPVIKTESVAPEGMHPQYKPNPKKGIMGPSAFNHLANNIGFEKAIQVWEDRYGKTNVPYKEFMAEYEKAAGKQMHGPVKPLAEGAKPGGSFGKPEFVPEYIRGSSSIEGMARAGLGALGILPVAKKIKEGDYKGALNEAIPASALIDPRISLALSPLYTSDEEIAILKKAEQARKAGAGRGIAPPSAYMR